MTTNMCKNRLKSLIQAGQPAIGSWIAFSDPYSVEIMAEVGFDWLLIDTEHCPISTDALRSILIAAKGNETIPVVRLMNNQADYFKLALDLGAQGVIVPMVQTVEDARRAVDNCRYPPTGSRGFGPVRASRYHLDLETYIRGANENILLVAQIESIQAVRNLDAILEVPGIDAIFIGPADLSASMNLLGGMKHPQVLKVIGEIMEHARSRKIPFGLPAGSPSELKEYVERGATLVTVGGDLGFLLNGAQESLRQTRALLG